MKTVNDAYKFYFKHEIKPTQVCKLWKKFSITAKKLKLKVEDPLFIEVCSKYARPDNES